jgi:hypothetical protein
MVCYKFSEHNKRPDEENKKQNEENDEKYLQEFSIEICGFF